MDTSGLHHPNINSESSSPLTDMSESNENLSLSSPAPCRYVIRTQSSYLHDDESICDAHHLNRLLGQDLKNRIAQVGESIAEELFPDDAFGFPINDRFVRNFKGSFISTGGILDPKNFYDDNSTAVFLNRMISTITHFLDDTKQVTLKPLRYFTAIHSTKPIGGHAFQRKPDNILVRLIDGYLREAPFRWSDSLALIEHTREKTPPIRMAETVTVKSFLTFCGQPERDYVVCLGITREGFHIAMTDHVGQLETDVIPFRFSSSTTTFFRMVMGLAFLPDTFLGLDTTINRREVGKRSKDSFAVTYKPFKTHGKFKPCLTLLASSPSHSADDSVAVTSTQVSPDGDDEISTISIGPNVYRVIRHMIESLLCINKAKTALSLLL
jgi:hypothetical protein